MPTFEADGKTAAIFIFNHIIARFGVPQAIITDHGCHFRIQVLFNRLLVSECRFRREGGAHPARRGLTTTTALD